MTPRSEEERDAPCALKGRGVTGRRGLSDYRKCLNTGSGSTLNTCAVYSACIKKKNHHPLPLSVRIQMQPIICSALPAARVGSWVKKKKKINKCMTICTTFPYFLRNAFMRQLRINKYTAMHPTAQLWAGRGLPSNLWTR